MNISLLKEMVQGEVKRQRDRLIRISQAIHAHPETRFQEYFAQKLLCTELKKSGFKVEKGIAELDTAFWAVLAGREAGPTIAFVAEYDALPALGHGCGHNLIAAASVGAALALRKVMPRLPGKISVVGAPGEEGGGGKAIMVNRGFFQGIDVAMLAHPADRTVVRTNSLAGYVLEVRFQGRPVHSARAPHDGINALEAVILTFNNINSLRQTLKDDVRIQGIISEGGLALNILPEVAAARFSIRSAKRDYLNEVVDKVEKCAQGAALATGAEVSFLGLGCYDELRLNTTLAGVFEANLQALGISPTSEESGLGATDMGNVSHVVPTIHPYFAIAPEGVAMHTHKFAELAVSDQAHAGMLVMAQAMAMTAIDVLADPELYAAIRQEFKGA
ncbi:MAG: M20 family metallopeptidase [Firmicutes bacterium]|nr:M20 family metallopeptidase [Bacillota bacterium]